MALRLLRRNLPTHGRQRYMREVRHDYLKMQTRKWMASQGRFLRLRNGLPTACKERRSVVSITKYGDRPFKWRSKRGLQADSFSETCQLPAPTRLEDERDNQTRPQRKLHVGVRLNSSYFCCSRALRFSRGRRKDKSLLWIN